MVIHSTVLLFGICRELPTTDEPPVDFTVLPEYFIDDMVDFVLFLAQSVDIFDYDPNFALISIYGLCCLAFLHQLWMILVCHI